MTSLPGVQKRAQDWACLLEIYETGTCLRGEVAAREQKEVYLEGMTRSGRRGWGGFKEIQAGARAKPGHSGRTGPRAGRPRLASSQLLYRTGSPVRLLQPPPEPGVRKAAVGC